MKEKIIENTNKVVVVQKNISRRNFLKQLGMLGFGFAGGYAASKLSSSEANSFTLQIRYSEAIEVDKGKSILHILNGKTLQFPNGAYLKVFAELERENAIIISHKNAFVLGPTTNGGLSGERKFENLSNGSVISFVAPDGNSYMLQLEFSSRPYRNQDPLLTATLYRGGPAQKMDDMAPEPKIFQASNPL